MSRLRPAALVPALRLVQPYTMLPLGAQLQLAWAVHGLLERGVPGSFVECGVWRGGSTFLMAELLRRAGEERAVWGFDSFAGLPEPSEIDGSAARAWPSSAAGIRVKNLAVPLVEVEAAAARLGLAGRVRLVPGWFSETLVRERQRIGPIALLRIDADWYESVRESLEMLYEQVVPGGLILVDDYYAWDGCAVAVHEFLGSRRSADRIVSMLGVAYFRKQG